MNFFRFWSERYLTKLLVSKLLQSEKWTDNCQNLFLIRCACYSGFHCKKYQNLYTCKHKLCTLSLVSTCEFNAFLYITVSALQFTQLMSRWVSNRELNCNFKVEFVCIFRLVHILDVGYYLMKRLFEVLYFMCIILYLEA